MQSKDSFYYQVRAKDAKLHVFEIQCAIPLSVINEHASNNKDAHAPIHPASDIQIALPRWIPGSYMLRQFARHMLGIKAYGAKSKTVMQPELDSTQMAGNTTEAPMALELKQIDTHTYNIAIDKMLGYEFLVICYEMYAYDHSVRGAHLDNTHGYFNGAAIFMYAKGFEHLSCQLTIIPHQPHFAIATAMKSVSNAPNTFEAQNFDELIDHPVEIGVFKTLKFVTCGIPHEIVYNPIYTFDTNRLIEDVQKICHYQLSFFGQPYPIERYVFLLFIVGAGYGGLEHRSSTTLMFSKDLLPKFNSTEIDENYLQLLGLFSHEYFHTFNVKRLKPAAFIPYDLTKEAMTGQLWWYEGITSYYDDLSLLRAGLITKERYLGLIASNISKNLQSYGRHRQTVIESSMNAWTKYYMQDENAPNSVISYYLKGALIALCLDIAIRAEHDDKSLDDFMHKVWNQYVAKHDAYLGSFENEFEQELISYAGSCVESILQLGLNTTQDLPLHTILASMGLDLTLEPNTYKGPNFKDKKESSHARYLKAPLTPQRVLGARLSCDKGFLIINQVYLNGAAHNCGLSALDMVLALNGLKVSSEEELSSLINMTQGPCTITAFRGDRLMHFECEFLPAPLECAVLSFKEDVDESILAKREKWIGM